MKKFGLLLLGGIAAIVLLHNLGPMIGLAISLVIFYFAFKGFLKTNSVLGKIGWGILGFIAIMSLAANVPAILGLLRSMFYISSIKNGMHPRKK